MTNRLSTISFIVFASLIEYFGDSSLKYYARTSELKYLILGINFYLVIVGILVYILKYINVSYMNLAWDGSSAILETLLAFLIMGERLNNNIQYLGGIFIVIGMFCLNYGPIPY
jgi:multidrug transporter EmrE-like cation transporter